MQEYSKTVGLIMLAFIAGLLGHLMRVIERGGKITWPRAALEASASGFVGYLAILLCAAMDLSFEWTGVVVGLFGWLGASASVKILEKVVHKRLGIDNKE